MTEDDFIWRDGYWWPASDDHLHKIIKRSLDDIDVCLKHVKGRKVAVQAGGNVGVWPNYLSKAFTLVHTVEPDIANYTCLQRNANGNVFHYYAAYGAKWSTAKVNRIEGNCGAGWMEEDGRVTVMPIDTYDLKTCDLIMLDVEGGEYAALLGARKTLERCKPVVHFEEKGLGVEHYGQEPGAVEAFLTSLGYKVVEKVRNDVIMVHGG